MARKHKKKPTKEDEKNVDQFLDRMIEIMMMQVEHEAYKKVVTRNLVCIRELSPKI